MSMTEPTARELLDSLEVDLGLDEQIERVIDDLASRVEHVLAECEALKSSPETRAIAWRIERLLNGEP